MLKYKNTFECADETTKTLLENFEPTDTKEKIFFKVINKQIFARKAKHLIGDRNALSEKIYYTPTYFPLLSKYDMRLGTAWDEWSNINFDSFYKFDQKDNQIIEYEKIRNKISLEQYIEQLLERINDNIEGIFNKSKDKTIYLSYSTGIDSLCILSFLIKKKMHNRIKLINFTNTMTTQKINSFQEEKKLGFEVENFKINFDDLARIINTNNFQKVLCYTTSTLFEKYCNGLFIFGFHGNQSLLHKKIFLEQIQKKVEKDGYCKSLDGWQPSKNFTPLKEHCLVVKPWHELQGSNNCNFFHPLGDGKIFDLIRSIDWEGVDPHTISNAEVARKIIYENVGNSFDSLITQENLYESDIILGDLEVPMQNLKNKIFNLDVKYCNRQGYDWLVSEYNESLSKKSIKLNTVISFLVQNFLNRLS